MDRNYLEDLIKNLSKLEISEDSFNKIYEEESKTLENLRKLYISNKEIFTEDDVKRINLSKENLKIAEEYLEIKDEIEFCKSKEALNDLIFSISDFMDRVSSEIHIARIKKDIRELNEKMRSLPEINPQKSSSLTVSHFNPVENCPKCNSKMILRLGPFSHFWGCSKFPDCWGKRPASRKK